MNKENIITIYAGDEQGIPFEFQNKSTEEASDISSLTNITFKVLDKDDRVIINKQYNDTVGDTIELDDLGVGGNGTITMNKGDTINLDGAYKYTLDITYGGNVIPIMKGIFMVQKGVIIE